MNHFLIILGYIGDIAERSRRENACYLEAQRGRA